MLNIKKNSLYLFFEIGNSNNFILGSVIDTFMDAKHYFLTLCGKSNVDIEN